MNWDPDKASLRRAKTYLDSVKSIHASVKRDTAVLDQLATWRLAKYGPADTRTFEAACQRGALQSELYKWDAELQRAQADFNWWEKEIQKKFPKKKRRARVPSTYDIQTS